MKFKEKKEMSYSADRGLFEGNPVNPVIAHGGIYGRQWAGDSLGFPAVYSRNRDGRLVPGSDIQTAILADTLKDFIVEGEQELPANYDFTGFSATFLDFPPSDEVRRVMYVAKQHRTNWTDEKGRHSLVFETQPIDRISLGEKSLYLRRKGTKPEAVSIDEVVISLDSIARRATNRLRASAELRTAIEYAEAELGAASRPGLVARMLGHFGLK